MLGFANLFHNMSLLLSLLGEHLSSVTRRNSESVVSFSDSVRTIAICSTAQKANFYPQGHLWILKFCTPMRVSATEYLTFRIKVATGSLLADCVAVTDDSRGLQPTVGVESALVA